MDKEKKAGIGPVVVFTAAGAAYLAFAGTAEANPYLDVWNYSFGIDKGEESRVVEGGLASSVPYNGGPARELRAYWWGPTLANPNNQKLTWVGIDSNKTYVLELRLEAETIANGSDNAIDLNYWGGIDGTGSPLQRQKRNFFMRQHPNGPRAGTPEQDTNIYDLLDLTNYFTENAQITLPDITAETPRTPDIYDKWQKIISNYADLKPSVFDGELPDGLVNGLDFALFAAYWDTTGHGAHDNWAKGADLDRDGDVYTIDLTLFAEQWLCDPNTIRTAMQTLPKDLYENLNQTASYILNNAGDQRVVCKLYQNQVPGLSEDMIQRLARKEDVNPLEQKLQNTNHEKPNPRQLLALSNNGHEPLSKNYETIDNKLTAKLQGPTHPMKLYL